MLPEKLTKFLTKELPSVAGFSLAGGMGSLGSTASTGTKLSGGIDISNAGIMNSGRELLA